MKIIHVDANRFAQDTMREQISQIVPDAELHCFDHPDTALAFAEAEGCDVLLTDTVFDGFSLDGTMLAEQVQRVNPNVNNVNNTLGVRPAFPDCQKCMESSMGQCIGQRNPVPFPRRHPREKHMLSETLDAQAFKALGVGDAPFPRQPIGRR